MSGAREGSLLERLGEAALEVLRARTDEAVFAAAADALEREGLYTVVLELLPDGERMAVRQARVYPDTQVLKPDAVAQKEIVWSISSMPVVAEAVRAGRVVHHEDLRRVVDEGDFGDDPENIKQRLQGHGLRELLVIPIRAAGKVRGVLAVLAPPLSSSEVAALSLFGANVSSALENADYIARLALKNRELAALNAIARESAETSAEALTQEVLPRLVSLLDVDAGRIWLNRGQELVLAGACGDVSRLPVGSAPSDIAAQASPEPGRLVVPLKRNGVAVGCLELGRALPRRFSDEERQMSETVAAQLAVALENARLRERVHRRMEELSLLNAVAQAGAQLDLQALLAGTLARACPALGFDVGLVYQAMEPTGRRLRLVATHGFRPGFRMQDGCEEEVERWLATERQPRPVVSADLPAFAPCASKEGLVRGVVVPLAVRDRLVGAMMLWRREDRPAGVEETWLLSSIGAQLAVTAETVRLVADLEAKNRHLEVVNEVGRAAGGSLDLDELMGGVFDRLQARLGLSGAALYLVDTGRKVFEVAAQRGASDRLLRSARRRPLDSPELALALTREEAYTMRLADYGDADVRTFLESEGVRALAMVPVRARGETIGVLVGWRKEEEPVPAESVALLSAISAQLGLAVQNARLFAETRRKVEELSLLNSIGRAVTESLDLNVILRSAAPRLAQLLDVPDCFIGLYDPKKSTLEGVAVIAAAGPAPQAFSFDFAETTLAREVIETNRPALVEDAHADPRVNPALRAQWRHTAYLAVPLALGGRAIGVVVLAETRGPRTFLPDEMQRALSTANQISLAIANARLYEDLRRSYAELARTQREFVKHERLAALGELSAVVAHEVRNPLGVIFNSLGSLAHLVHGEDASVLLSIIGEEAQRLNRMVTDLLDFARPMEPTLHPEPLDKLVEDALASAGRTAGQPNVQVQVKVEHGDVRSVPMDARLVRQALVNLFVNAYQAMPKGGTLTVRTSRGFMAGREMALVEVEDTGPGIELEVQERIFQPFFTTRATGAGLGLAVVKRIVDAHGGEIIVQSEPGAGTRFIMGIPLGVSARGVAA